MSTHLPPSSSGDLDPFNPDRFRLPADLVGDLSTPRRPPRHRPGEPFLKGPIPYDWIATACRLPGSGLAVAVLVWFLRDRYRRRNWWGLEEIGRRLDLSPQSARRGLRSAELAGLLDVDRGNGRKPRVGIRGTIDCARGRKIRPLYGPVPWAWWATASHLPTCALRTASACWLLAGQDRSADVELVLSGWKDFGLSRPSASRGLDHLEREGLVGVERRPGLSPIVSIRERRWEGGDKP